MLPISENDLEFHVNSTQTWQLFFWDSAVLILCHKPCLSLFSGCLNPGAREAMEKGALIGHPVQGIRVALQDGQTHTVDSSDMAFRFAAMMAVRESILKAGAQVLEPIMSVEVSNISYRNCNSIYCGLCDMVLSLSHYRAVQAAERACAHRCFLCPVVDASN